MTLLSRRKRPRRSSSRSRWLMMCCLMPRRDSNMIWEELMSMAMQMEEPLVFMILPAQEIFLICFKELVMELVMEDFLASASVAIWVLEATLVQIFLNSFSSKWDKAKHEEDSSKASDLLNKKDNNYSHL